MTDYSSQGKTREFNVVELNYSRNHLNIYTALSRGSSAAGTCILSSVPASKITHGIDGALRQEFRELELLDYITLLKYESRLPSEVLTGVRNSTIQKFLEKMGDADITKHLHHAIRWSNKDPLVLHSEFDKSWEDFAKKPINKK
ncbi:hypothetical protein BDN72DRAFT_744462, partial [Pluteus cervinus]